MVSADKEYLIEVSIVIKQYLQDRLELRINDGKTKIVSVWEGVEFLGAYVKPYRQYASKQMVDRIRLKLRKLDLKDKVKLEASLNSFCGLLSHGRNYNLRKKLFLLENSFPDKVVFDDSLLKCI